MQESSINWTFSSIQIFKDIGRHLGGLLTYANNLLWVLFTYDLFTVWASQALQFPLAFHTNNDDVAARNWQM